jgi:GntR family transcriptional regulator
MPYQRISSELEQEIRAGVVGHGQRLPGEHELAQRFGVSRMTVRHALAELVEKRLVSTRPGAGSFITFDDRQLDWEQGGMSRALAPGGARLESRVLRFGPCEDETLARRFEAGAHFIVLDRLRVPERDRPVSLERSRVPLDERTSALLDIDFAHESLMDALRRRAGRLPASAEETIEVARLTTEEAHALERAIGTAFLLVRRVSRDAEGYLVEHVTTLLDPAHFRLHIEFDLRAPTAR